MGAMEPYRLVQPALPELSWGPAMGPLWCDWRAPGRGRGSLRITTKVVHLIHYQSLAAGPCPNPHPPSHLQGLGGSIPWVPRSVSPKIGWLDSAGAHPACPSPGAHLARPCPALLIWLLLVGPRQALKCVL